MYINKQTTAKVGFNLHSIRDDLIYWKETLLALPATPVFNKNCKILVLDISKLLWKVSYVIFWIFNWVFWNYDVDLLKFWNTWLKPFTMMLCSHINLESVYNWPIYILLEVEGSTPLIRAPVEGLGARQVHVGAFSPLFGKRKCQTKHAQFKVKIYPNNIFGVIQLMFWISAL